MKEQSSELLVMLLWQQKTLQALPYTAQQGQSGVNRLLR